MAERASPSQAPAPPVQGGTGDAAGRAPNRAADGSKPSAWPPSPAGLRRRILVQLRLDGPSSPDDLAAELGASRTGILQQLRGLEAAGLVTRTAERHGVGRPRHRYDIAPAAQNLVPAAYDGLAAGLLRAIDELGGEDLLADVFAVRRDHQATVVRTRMADRLAGGASLLDRVRELAAIQDEQGYLAEATIADDGTIRLVERNCAIHRVATDQPAACQAEVELFEDVLGATVERECHIATGDRCCSYRIGPAAQAD
jgi:predicted ArsR family transcriptional regulator